MNIYYIETEGWVSEEWLLWDFLRATNKIKEYDLLKNRDKIIKRVSKYKERKCKYCGKLCVGILCRECYSKHTSGKLSKCKKVQFKSHHGK